MTHKQISQFNKMCNIFHLLSENVCKIQFSINMLDGDKVGYNILADPVFPHLYMSKTLSCSFPRPLDTCFVVIEDYRSSGHEDMFNIKKGKKLIQSKRNLTHSSVAYISASAELAAVTF